MIRLSRLVLFTLVPWAMTAVALAQPTLPDDCPAFVRVALESVDNSCGDTGRNQTCYGNIAIDVVPREGVPDLNFNTIGDLANLGDLSVMTLAGLDLDGEIWGVALMRVQANIPDTLPGQNVTFLLFGDVLIENLAADAPEVEVSATGNVNIRLRPTTNANNIVASLARGQVAIANGILADRSWIRVRVEGIRNVTSGWVSADFLQATDGNDLAALNVVDPSAGTFGPMQAFYFSTGIGQPACRTAPEDGVLIQTPKGVGRINLNMNGVDVTIGSTAFLQSGGGFTSIYMLEGFAVLSFGGVRQFVPAGTFSQFPVGEDGFVSGPPQFPQPYNPQKFENLPLGLLPDPITPAPPIQPEQIEQAVQETEEEAQTPPGGGTGGGSDQVQPGLWTATRTVTESTCPNVAVGTTSSTTAFIAFDPDNDSFRFEGILMQRVGTGVFRFTTQESGGSATVTLSFLNPTQFTLSALSTRADCTFTSTGNGQFISP